MRDQPGKYRIAMLAPPWLPVPPPGYGGIESVVALLCDGLVRRGHDVTLFAAPGSRSTATVRTVLPACYPARIERALHEADHVTRVFDAVDQAATSGRPYDVIHDHCGFTAFAMADRIATPLVHTLHGPFTEDTSDFYGYHARKATAVAISASQRDAAPAALRIAAVIPNPIDVASWPLCVHKGDYLLWVGRMTAEKGPHRAIKAARIAEVPLVLAGPVQPGQKEFFQREIEPHIDGVTVRYVGEIGGARKRRLFAEALGLLMPIRWPEPFGMVMIEALSCGTPVLTFAEGAAPEIVQHGVTGYIVADETELAAAIPALSRLDPAACRQAVEDHFGVDQVTRSYEQVYAHATTQFGDQPVPRPARSTLHNLPARRPMSALPVTGMPLAVVSASENTKPHSTRRGSPTFSTRASTVT